MTMIISTPLLLILAGASVSPIVAPADAPRAEPGDAPRRHTVFLDFDGGTFESGTNAAEDESSCVGPVPVEVPPYGGTEAQRAAIVAVVTTALQPFGLRVVETPPPRHLPYTRVVFGGDGTLLDQPAFAYSSPCTTDCGDMWWRDTGHVFTAPFVGETQTLGQAALYTLGHAWGLDNLAGTEFFMNYLALAEPRAWSDACVPLDSEQSQIHCAHIHEMFCGDDSGQQNDVAELTALFGVNSPDVAPPTVTLLSPQDGQVFSPGETVTIEAELTDDHGGFGWHLTIPELDQDLPAYAFETKWSAGFPKGEYTVRVEALDHDGNVGFGEAKIYVGVSPPAETGTGTDTGTDGGDDTGSTSAAPTTGEGTGQVLTSGADPDPGSSTGEDTGDTAGAEGTPEGKDGCTCSTGHVPNTTSLIALGLLALLQRRRR